SLSANSLKRLMISDGSASGSERYSHRKEHFLGMMLSAVPPRIVPTLMVVKGGLKRPDGSPRSRISSARRIRKEISSVAYWMALTPRWVWLEWNSSPVTVV